MVVRLKYKSKLLSYTNELARLVLVDQSNDPKYRGEIVIPIYQPKWGLFPPPNDFVTPGNDTLLLETHPDYYQYHSRGYFIKPPNKEKKISLELDINFRKNGKYVAIYKGAKEMVVSKVAKKYPPNFLAKTLEFQKSIIQDETLINGRVGECINKDGILCKIEDAVIVTVITDLYDYYLPKTILQWF